MSSPCVPITGHVSPQPRGNAERTRVPGARARVRSFPPFSPSLLLSSSPCFSLPCSPFLFLGFHPFPPFPPFFLKFYRITCNWLHPPLQPSSRGSAPPLLPGTHYRRSSQSTNLSRSLSCSRTSVASDLLLLSCLSPLLPTFSSRTFPPAGEVHFPSPQGTLCLFTHAVSSARMPTLLHPFRSKPYGIWEAFQGSLCALP